MKNLKSIFFIVIPFIFIVLYVLYYLSYKKHEATDSQANNYIQASKIIQFSGIKIVKFHHEQYTHFFATASYPKSKLVVLIKPVNSDKYFVIEEYGNKQSNISLGPIESSTINLTVNADEYHATEYGSKDNPVPALNFKDANSPEDIFISDAQYHKNVKEYLTYDKKINSKK